MLTSVDGASVFTLMPVDWYSYSLPDNKIIIPKGKFLGDFTISIDKAKFTNDPLSLTKKYALPFRILDSSADSVLRGDDVVKPKDYTIIVMKYINEFSGAYYVRGEQFEVDADDNDIVATKKTYYHVDWSRNLTRDLVTSEPNVCEMTGMGDQTSGKIKATFGTNTITLTTVDLPITDLGSTYSDGVYHLKYKYEKGGKTFRVDEYLKQRNDPEKDLRFEEW